MEENRWADEEFDGSHSKRVSCRLNIVTTLVSVMLEILVKYKNNLFFATQCFEMFRNYNLRISEDLSLGH